MKTTQIIVTVALTLLTTACLAVVAVWSLWPATAEASSSVLMHSAFPNDGAESGGHCARLANDHTDIAKAVVGEVLDLSDAQKAQLEPIAEVMDRWQTQAYEICNNTQLHTADGGLALDGGLTGMEQILSVSAASVAELRPLVTEFYATLDPAQVEKIESHMQRAHDRRGHRWGRGHHGH